MKKTTSLIVMAAAGLLAALTGAPDAHAATNVGVSISVSQPGVYGRIDIGQYPQPAVVMPQPVIIHQPRVVYQQPVQPVYLWVPPGHQKNWAKHCSRYRACGVPVYFVREDWYREHIAPPPRYDEHGRGRGPDGYGPPGQSRGHGHGHD